MKSQEVFETIKAASDRCDSLEILDTRSPEYQEWYGMIMRLQRLGEERNEPLVKRYYDWLYHGGHIGKEEAEWMPEFWRNENERIKDQQNN